MGGCKAVVASKSRCNAKRNIRPLLPWGIDRRDAEGCSPGLLRIEVDLSTTHGDAVHGTGMQH